MKSLLVSGILLDLFSMIMCCQLQCSDQLKPNVNSVESSYIIESSEPDVIGFVGHSARFWLKVNLSTLSTPRIMRIYKNNYCSVGKQSCGPICTVEFDITSLSISDNDTDISFCLVSPSTICFSSSSHLIVKDIPPPVKIYPVSDGCKEIEVSYSAIDSDTQLQCEVYHSVNSEPELIYNNTHCNDSNPFVLHSNIIKNHTGIYRIIIQPSNPAGFGVITEEEIQLGTDTLEFNVTGIFAEIHKGYLFYARIDIQVNESCTLSIPDFFNVSSNCSSDTPETYEQNGHLFHQLEKQKEYCLFNITDSGGNLKTVATDIRTFHNQDVIIHLCANSIVFASVLMIDSAANGCFINITRSNSTGTTDHSFEALRLNNKSLHVFGNTKELMPGDYKIECYDIIDKTIESTQVFQTSISIFHLTSCTPNEKQWWKGPYLLLIVVVIGIVIFCMVSIVIYCCCKKSDKSKMNSPELISKNSLKDPTEVSVGQGSADEAIAKNSKSLRKRGGTMPHKFVTAAPEYQMQSTQVFQNGTGELEEVVITTEPKKSHENESASNKDKMVPPSETLPNSGRSDSCSFPSFEHNGDY